MTYPIGDNRHICAVRSLSDPNLKWSLHKQSIDNDQLMNVKNTDKTPFKDVQKENRK